MVTLNQYSQIFCNPFYAAFFTVPHKDRLTILDILLCGKERTYIFDSKAFSLLSDFNVSKKVIGQITQLTDVKEISGKEMQELLGKIFPDAEKGKNTKTRIMESAAIAAYQRQTEIPIINILLSDDAPQFKKLTLEHALCWIHDGRHYNRLSPIVPLNVSYLNSGVKLKNLNFKKNKYCNINNLFFKPINLPRNLNRIPKIMPNCGPVKQGLLFLAQTLFMMF